MRISVKVERRRGRTVYVYPPSTLLDRFLKEVEKVLSSLDMSRKSNRVLAELLDEEREVVEILKRRFLKADTESLAFRKAACDLFYRIFQRLRWAKEAGSEREIELRGWILSSFDLLLEIFGDSDEGD